MSKKFSFFMKVIYIMLCIMSIINCENVSFAETYKHSSGLTIIVPDQEGTLLNDEGEILFNVEFGYASEVEVEVINEQGNLKPQFSRKRNESIEGFLDVYEYEYKRGNFPELRFTVRVKFKYTLNYAGLVSDTITYPLVYKYKPKEEEFQSNVPYINNYGIIYENENQKTNLYVYYNGCSKIVDISVADLNADKSLDITGGTIGEIVYAGSFQDYKAYNLKNFKRSADSQKLVMNLKINYQDYGSEDVKNVCQQVTMYWNYVPNNVEDEINYEPYIEHYDTILKEVPYKIVIQPNYLFGAASGAIVGEENVDGYVDWIHIVGAKADKTNAVAEVSGGTIIYDMHQDFTKCRNTGMISGALDKSFTFIISDVKRTPGARDLVFNLGIRYKVGDTTKKVYYPVKIYYDEFYGIPKPPYVDVSNKVEVAGNKFIVTMNDNYIKTFNVTPKDENSTITAIAQTGGTLKEMYYTVCIKAKDDTVTSTDLSVDIEYTDINGETKQYNKVVTMYFKDVVIEETEENSKEEDIIGTGIYGDPKDLKNVLHYKNGVGSVIHSYAKVLSAILTFAVVIMIGVNIILARHKAEERVNAMTGLMYIIIGTIILDAVVLIYLLMTSGIGDQASQVQDVTGIIIETSADDDTDENESEDADDDTENENENVAPENVRPVVVTTDASSLNNTLAKGSKAEFWIRFSDCRNVTSVTGEVVGELYARGINNLNITKDHNEGDLDAYKVSFIPTQDINAGTLVIVFRYKHNGEIEQYTFSQKITVKEVSAQGGSGHSPSGGGGSGTGSNATVNMLY